MKIRKPDYYDRFFCKGNKCKRNCCEGWTLEIDSDTYDYYNAVPGEFGDRLRACTEEMLVYDDEEDKVFCLEINGRCPFLNDENLCDIVLNLGEESLCEICATYPRASYEYGDTLELFLTPSCEEACRLMFENMEGIEFIEEESEYEKESRYEDEMYLLEEELGKDYEKIRDKCIKIIWGENGFDEGFKELKEYILDVQKEVNESDENPDKKIYFTDPEERVEILKSIDPINEEFRNLQKEMEPFFKDGKLKKALEDYHSLDNDLFEKKIFSYFLLRYMPGAVYDYDYISKLYFAWLNLLIIEDIFAKYYYENGDITKQDRMDMVSDYSRQVEHSEYNMDNLLYALI